LWLIRAGEAGALAARILAASHRLAATGLSFVEEGA
jgi:hypothetical protein